MDNFMKLKVVLETKLHYYEKRLSTGKWEDGTRIRVKTSMTISGKLQGIEECLKEIYRIENNEDIKDKEI